MPAQKASKTPALAMNFMAFPSRYCGSILPQLPAGHYHGREPGGAMDFELSENGRAWRERVQAFFDAHILTRNREWHEHVVKRDEPAPFMRELQGKAREQGLWNLGLPELADSEPGTRLSNLDYAGCCEILVRRAASRE